MGFFMKQYKFIMTKEADMHLELIWKNYLAWTKRFIVVFIDLRVSDNLYIQFVLDSKSTGLL